MHQNLFWQGMILPWRLRQLSTTVCLQIIDMMTSSNGNIFSVTGPLCGVFTGPGEFPAQRPVTRNFDVLFDLHLNKWLSKQPWACWFEMPSWSLCRQCNENNVIICVASQLIAKLLNTGIPTDTPFRFCFGMPVLSVNIFLWPRVLMQPAIVQRCWD